MLNTAYGTNCCHVVTGVVRVSLLSIVLIVDGVLRVFLFFRFYVLCLVLYRIGILLSCILTATAHHMYDAVG